MLSDTFGELAFAIVPSWSYSSLVSGILAGPPGAGDYSLGGGFSGAPPLTGAETIRLVSFGVRIKRVTAPLTTSGMIHVRGIPTQGGATNLASIAGLSYGSSGYLDIPLQDAKDIVLIGQRTSQPPEAFYKPTDINTGVFMSGYTTPGFAPISVYISGGPASTALVTVEAFYHWECTFSTTNQMQVMATAAPVSNPLITQTVKAIQSTASTMFHSSVEAAASYVKRIAITQLAAFVGGPTAPLLANAAYALVD